jgi:hypothetical protein
MTTRKHENVPSVLPRRACDDIKNRVAHVSSEIQIQKQPTPPVTILSTTTTTTTSYQMGFFLRIMLDNLVDKGNRFDKQYYLVSSTQKHLPFWNCITRTTF